MRSVLAVVVCLLAVPQLAGAQQQPGAATADDAARAAFEHALSFHDFDSFELGVAARPDHMQTLIRSIDDAVRRRARALERLEPVLAHRRPRWSIAALVERGRIHETFARGLREPPVVALPHQAADLEIARRAFARRAGDAECRAMVEYLRAVRLARSERLETPEALVARDRLRARSARTLRRCIEAGRRDDPSLDRFHADELELESGRN